MKHKVLATPTGFEPVVFAVTGQRDNQLRYGAKFQDGLLNFIIHLIIVKYIKVAVPVFWKGVIIFSYIFIIT